MLSLPIIIVAGVALLMMVGAGFALMSSAGQASVEERLDQFVGRAPIEAAPEESGQRTDMADRLDKALAGQGFFAPIKARISRADIRLRVSEYIIIVIFSALAVGYAAYRFFDGSLLLAIPFVLVGTRLPPMYMNRAATRRIRAFDNQLSDTLNLWVNSLRSGYSVLQGMEAIATELPPPVSKEFERVVQEVRLGLGLDQALANMLRRVPSEDLDLVVTAVNIQREVGGNLAEILDIISYTIRERVRIKGEIRTLTAQGRASGWIITFVPVVLALILYGINRDYIMQLFIREKPFIIPNILPCGWVIVAVSVIMIAIGGVIIQRIVDIEV